MMERNIRYVLTFMVAALLLAFSQTVWSQDEMVDTEVAVTVGRIQKTTLHSYLTAYGYVETAPARQGAAPAGARIAAPVSGVVSEVVCYEGQRVDKGAVLCLLDSRIAEVGVSRAEQALAFAEKAWQREKELQTSDATSEKKLQEAEAAYATARIDLSAARLQLSLHEVTAPISGTITRIGVRLGQSVDANTVVTEIADFTHLVAALKVPASEVSVLKPGQSVEIKTENNDAPISGKLGFISSRVDAGDGAMTAYAILPASTLLKPGRFVSARIASDEHRDCLAVPEASVVKDSESGWIISLVKDSRALRVPVNTGFRENGLVEVASDSLSEGMTVVKVGAYGLPDNTRIRITGTAETEAGK